MLACHHDQISICRVARIDQSGAGLGTQRLHQLACLLLAQRRLDDWLVLLGHTGGEARAVQERIDVIAHVRHGLKDRLRQILARRLHQIRGQGIDHGHDQR